MARLYWYGLTLIYLTCASVGLLLSYSTWGIGGALLGIILGAMAAAGVALILNTPEKMENAVYGILSVLVAFGIVYLIVTFWGVRF